MPKFFSRSKKSSLSKRNTIKKPSPEIGGPLAPISNQNHSSSGSSGKKHVSVEKEFESDKFHPALIWNELRAPNRDSKLIDRLVHRKKRNEGDIQISTCRGRRESIEKRTMEDPYHASLVNGGVLLPSDDSIAGVTDAQLPSASELTEDESSNTQDAQVLNHDLTIPSDESQPPMITILCGRQNPASCFFTRRLVKVCDNGMYSDTNSTPSSSLLSCPELDPDANELYSLWQRTGAIPIWQRDVDFGPTDLDPGLTWIASWPLMNAAIHGHRIGDFPFVDRVMDLLQEKLVETVRPDKGTISHVFGRNTRSIPDVLRVFIIDRWIAAGVEGFRYEDLSDHPRLFVHSALGTALQRLSYTRQSSSLTGCGYHTHATTESCYRNAVTPTGTRSPAQHQDRRDKSSRSSDQLMTDSRKNSFKTTDWKVHRDEENQKMHEQTGKSWVGFRRLAVGSRRDRESAYGKSPGTHSGSVLPSPSATPEVQDNAATAPQSVFGTVQTAGAVDDIRVDAPTREQGPVYSRNDERLAFNPDSGSECPVSIPDVQLQNVTTSVAVDSGTPSGYEQECFLVSYGDTPVAELAGGSKLPHPSEKSAGSAPVIELGSAVETSSKSRKHATCPGAFPESRTGSLRSVILGRESSRDVI
ncbi:hypothetical protein BDW02DRAFT_166582 [Decorospora gaudefroyi]|uniref:Uncharacterized protein n=1 Tax=Decorospora gaudefroyi TaxID=184978 RepID=A0A6A5JYL0_9PLEO|nr:hypothetical protein BDW02DRAFT_166582 [Decorospora gaudefroyi]